MMLTYRFGVKTGVLGLLALGALTTVPYLAYTGALQPDEIAQRAIPSSFIIAISLILTRLGFDLKSAVRGEKAVPPGGGDALFWLLSVIALVGALFGL